MPPVRHLLIPILALLVAAPALANDSSAAIGVGGLTLTQNTAISMDEEDLFLSLEEVRVRYRFTNRSDRDVETLVSFPVPSVPDGIRDYLGDRESPDFRTLDFRTTIEGKPVTLDYVERVEANGRDVSMRLAQLGWPVRWHPDTPDALDFIDKLSDAQKQSFVREGLLRKAKGYDGVEPAWNLITHVTRRQVFPAGRTVEVTHRYKPMVGGSVGGALNRESRLSDYHAGHVRKFCVDRAFLAGFDRRAGSGPPESRGFEIEHWLSYILSSGRNWRGPIGQFRLVVDKGKPENLVSFCMDGVKKISPTQFEVRKTNFEPTRDIDVLVVEWIKPE